MFSGIALAMVASMSSAAETPPSGTFDIDWTPPPRATISLEETVELPEISSPVVSRNGDEVAFLISRRSLTCDCTRTAIYVRTLRGDRDPRKLGEFDGVADLAWDPAGAVTFLTDGHIWQLNTHGGEPTRLSPLTSGLDASCRIASYQWAPGGRSLAFVAFCSPPRAAGQQQASFVYDDTQMSAADLQNERWNPQDRYVELWTATYSLDHAARLWRSHRGSWSSAGPIAWSPDGTRIAFAFNRDVFNDDVAVIDVPTSNLRWTTTQSGNVTAIAWSPDGRTLAALGRESTTPYLTIDEYGAADGRRRRVLDRIGTGAQQERIHFSDDGREIYFISDGMGTWRENRRLRAVDAGGRVRVLSSAESKLSSCDLASSGAFICIAQSPTSPPRLVELNSSGELERVVATPVSGIDPSRIRVEMLRWSNSFGEATNGYLLLPVSAATERLPLVVMAYAFDGDFITSANSILNNYPARALAESGFAVLLFNYPRFDGWEDASFARGSRRFGLSPLSSIQSIIRLLDRRGLIDRHRVGMMGHSLGGLWGFLAATRTDLFRTVAIHNGGSNTEPGSYWMYGTAWGRILQDRMMGGGPYGPTLSNYRSYSITQNACHIHIPILMESNASEAGSGFEYLAAFRAQGVPLEYLIYPREAHVFSQPTHILASMQVNIDWMRFWLLGEEDSNIVKRSQYGRWRVLRAQQIALSRRSSRHGRIC